MLKESVTHYFKNHSAWQAQSESEYKNNSLFSFFASAICKDNLKNLKH